MPIFNSKNGHLQILNLNISYSINTFIILFRILSFLVILQLKKKHIIYTVEVKTLL